MSIIIVATIIPNREHREEVIALLTDVAEKVHANDAGCELYALHQGKDRLVMIEKWADSDALKAHGAGEATAALNAGLAGKLASKVDLQFLQAIPAGTAEQGTL